MVGINSVRSILMRLIFNLKYKTIDDNMSDSNVGGRKNKSGINHIWVLNNIIQDQISSVKKKPVVIQQYDYKQMFDSMDASEACGDMFSYGVNDDHLNIIHEANKEIVINVKTPQGLSEEYTLTSRIMQGDTWSSAMASAQVDSFGKEMLVEEPTFMFRFKGEVPIPILGQVDDIIGVAEAGFKTDQLNAYINVKTADKELQFGPSKCKAMIVSKVKPEIFHKPNLSVDSWDLVHHKNGSMTELFKGKVNITEETSLMFLGYMLSNHGDNMKNIIHKKNKSIGTQKQILKLIKPLGPYTFEGALIYIKSLIRNSILYAAETMIYVKESEYKALELIEESVLVNALKTKRTCPKHLIYLEVGLVPARYQVQRQVLNFLQYVLQQPNNSLISRMFHVMVKNPTKGDWASNAITLIEKFELNMDLNEIQNMKPSLFKQLVKKQMRKIAFRDLNKIHEEKQKGKFIKYNCLTMADYLLPEANLTTEDKLQLFSVRTEMNDNPFNYGGKDLCNLGCQEFQNNSHILSCLRVNEDTQIFKYEDFLNGPLKLKVQIFEKFKENLIRREQLRDSV